ncbi:hypothetical protein VPHK469_0120 [Vibrio phage K469]
MSHQDLAELTHIIGRVMTDVRRSGSITGTDTHVVYRRGSMVIDSPDRLVVVRPDNQITFSVSQPDSRIYLNGAVLMDWEGIWNSDIIKAYNRIREAIKEYA